MGNQKEATESRMAKWRQLIEAKEQSGQSVSEFCEAEGVSRSVYSYWRQKLKNEECAEAVEDIVPSGWTRLESSEDVLIEAALTIEINGCFVNVTDATEPELLTKVCRTLKAL